MSAVRNGVIRRASARHDAVLIVAMWLFCVADAQAGIAGRWRIDSPDTGPEIVVIDQVGNDVTFTYHGIAFSGSISFLGGATPAERLSVFGSGGGGFRCDGAIVAAIRDQERRFFGTLMDFGIADICFGPFTASIAAEQCECFDGNLADGDGCDAHCQIEPCFSCGGDLSQCVPLADGAACDDHRDCTTGETCTAGVCEGSPMAPPCFDLSGPWRWRFDYAESDPLFEDVETNVSFVQRDGYIMRFTQSGNVADSGPIDPSTGTFHLFGAPRDVKDLISLSLCVGGASGHTTNAGQTIEGGATVATYGAAFCAMRGSTVTGSRCINGVVETDEQCDDDNVIAGDGCDPTCRIEPCFSCSGLRSVCAPLADGTTCDDTDPETARTECESGACVVPPPCPGDCNDDGLVIINELVTGVNIAFGRAAVEDCSSIDTNGSGAVDIGELTFGVRKLLHGCQE